MYFVFRTLEELGPPSGNSVCVGGWVGAVICRLQGTSVQWIWTPQVPDCWDNRGPYGYHCDVMKVIFTGLQGNVDQIGDPGRWRKETAEDKRKQEGERGKRFLGLKHDSDLLRAPSSPGLDYSISIRWLYPHICGLLKPVTRKPWSWHTLWWAEYCEGILPLLPTTKCNNL